MCVWVVSNSGAMGQSVCMCPGTGVQECMCVLRDVWWDFVATCVCAGRHSRISYVCMDAHMYGCLSSFFPNSLKYLEALCLITLKFSPFLSKLRRLSLLYHCIV